jgi:hypothetical protein
MTSLRSVILRDTASLFDTVMGARGLARDCSPILRDA